MAASDLLTSVETAITAILTGAQSYKIGNREVTRANLKELIALRTQLQEEVAGGGSMASLGEFISEC